MLKNLANFYVCIKLLAKVVTSPRKAFTNPPPHTFRDSNKSLFVLIVIKTTTFFKAVSDKKFNLCKCKKFNFILLSAFIMHVAVQAVTYNSKDCVLKINLGFDKGF